MGRGVAIVMRANLPYGRMDSGAHGDRMTHYIVHAMVISNKRRDTSHKHDLLDDNIYPCHNNPSIKQSWSTDMTRKKLSDQQVLEIRQRAAEGVTARTMAQELKVSAETIRRIVRRETRLTAEAEVGREMVEELEN